MSFRSALFDYFFLHPFNFYIFGDINEKNEKLCQKWKQKTSDEIISTLKNLKTAGNSNETFGHLYYWSCYVSQSVKRWLMNTAGFWE